VLSGVVDRDLKIGDVTPRTIITRPTI